MRILGLDVGERRIGVAVSDALGFSAQGLTVLERQTLPADLDAVAALVATYAAQRLVVGLPLTLKGERGPQAQRVVSFAEALQRRVTIPVVLQDERLTTVQGQRALASMGTSARKRKAVIDRVAAQLILQHYLDASQARLDA